MISTGVWKILRYFLAPEVPWFYRVLFFATAALFIAGAIIDINVLPTTTDQTGATYTRLAKLADFFYDFGKVSFGILIGGLSALVSSKKDEPKDSIEQEKKES